MGMGKAARLMMMHREHGGEHSENSSYEHDKHEANKHDQYDKDMQNGSGEAYSRDFKFTKEKAEQWVKGMKSNAVNGGKWTYDQTSQLMRQKGYTFDAAVWYAVMNMLYSDYAETLTKYGITGADVYAELACDWLEDEDIHNKDDKTALYYEGIVK